MSSGWVMNITMLIIGLVVGLLFGTVENKLALFAGFLFAAFNITWITCLSVALSKPSEDNVEEVVKSND